MRAIPLALVLAAIIFPAGLALAKSQDLRTPAAEREVRAVRVTHPPRLDGTLDDPLWQKATPASSFRQREPVEGDPASEATEVRLLYDAHHIYVGVFCYDSNPKAIIATQLRRDLDMSLDDNFAVIIDPTGSRRNGYVFEVNPLGTQLDGEVIEEQGPNGANEIVDPSWDGLWISAGHINQRGWTATISIPFSTLNFEPGSVATWGMDFRRFIRRKNEVPQGPRRRAEGSRTGRLARRSSHFAGLRESQLRFDWEGKYAAAIEQFKKTLEMDPNFVGVHSNLAAAYEKRSMYERAVQELERAAQLSGNPEMAGVIAQSYAKSGYNGVRRARLEKFLADRAGGHYVPAQNLAELYLELGDKEQGLRWLQAAYDERDSGMVFLNVSDELTPCAATPGSAPSPRRSG